MTLFEKLEKEIADVKIINCKNSMEDGDVELGPLTDRELRFYSLSRRYHEDSKQLAATLISMPDDASEEDKDALKTQGGHFHSLSELCMEIMWAEIRIRFLDTLSQKVHDGIGVRAGNIAVVRTKKSSSSSLLDMLKKLGELGI